MTALGLTIVTKLRRMDPVSFLASIEDHEPRLRAMTHYLDDEGIIWYPSLKDCGKITQIRGNPNVAVCFYDSSGQLAPQTLYGRAEIIEDAKTAGQIYQHFAESIGAIVPAAPGSDNFVFIKITVQTSILNCYQN